MATRRVVGKAGLIIASAAILLGVTALLLLAQSAPSLQGFGRRHLVIIGVNISAGVLLLALIVGNLVQLIRDYRRRAPGSRLRLRLVTMFVGLTVAPLFIVYLFALNAINSGIDDWFDSDLGTEISSALKLSRAALDTQATSRLQQTGALAAALGNLDGDPLLRALGVLRTDAGAAELTVFNGQLQIVGSSMQGERLPPRLAEDVLAELQRAKTFVALEPEADDRYQIRAAVTIPGDRYALAPRYLQAIFPIAGRQGRLADAVEDTYMRYAELRYLRGPLKFSLALTLSLVLLLSLLAAAAGAFYFARRLSAPIQALAIGTEAVARGNFDTHLARGAADEIGFLIESFNGMIERLKRAREEGRRSQQQLENERTRLATILGSLSTGVIALAPDGTLRIANDAAGRVLGFDPTTLTGTPWTAIGQGNSIVAQFVEALQPHLQGTPAEWRGQIVLRTDSSRRILNCASSPLPGDTETGGGAIVVFDDVTELLLAQRDAAWGEVARRLAHEIKNPLTPIRLAAERIRRWYLPNMDGEDGKVLDRSTHTIVQQVEAMRDMVNAFSEYARAPAINLAHVDLTRLIREVAWLYRAQEGQPVVQLKIEEDIGIDADAVRVRQLLHNLIRNAQEALEGQTGAHIEIAAGFVPGTDSGMVEISVTDNGPGIAAELLPRLFEPYVTNKTKGTGLGLAIVRKLVEEHGGAVQAENVSPHGARLAVRLPVRGRSAETPGENRSLWSDDSPDTRTAARSGA
jgi:nitrogen fixation/metabolism regulation signal transduction histidine kinase